MNKQLAELATYRKELQGLYEQTHAELQASRADAACEKVERDKLSAENALLRRWNAQLSDELSVIMSELAAVTRTTTATDCPRLPSR